MIINCKLLYYLYKKNVFKSKTYTLSRFKFIIISLI